MHLNFNAPAHLRILMLCGICLILIGLAYLIIAWIFLKYTLTPTDLLSTGMGFIGLALAMNDTKSMAK